MTILNVKILLDQKASKNKSKTGMLNCTIRLKKKCVLESEIKKHLKLTKINQNIQRLNNEQKKQEHIGKKRFQVYKKT